MEQHSIQMPCLMSVMINQSLNLIFLFNTERKSHFTENKKNQTAYTKITLHIRKQTLTCIQYTVY